MQFVFVDFTKWTLQNIVRDIVLHQLCTKIQKKSTFARETPILLFKLVIKLSKSNYMFNAIGNMQRKGMACE